MAESRWIRARWWSVLMTAGLLTACTVPTNQPIPTGDLGESSTSSAPATTSRVPPAGPQDICGAALVWDPGVAYMADCFLIPVTFTPTEPGWRSVRSGPEWIELAWIERASHEVTYRLLFLLVDDTEPPDQVLDSVLTIEGVDVLRPPTPTEIAGIDALVADVETEPRPATGTDRTCTSMTHAVNLFAGERPGYLLLDRTGVGHGAAYGLGACLAFRIWTMGVDDVTVTVIAAAESADQLRQADTPVESVLATATFDSG